MHDWRRDGSAKKSALHGILQATGGGGCQKGGREIRQRSKREVKIEIDIWLWIYIYIYAHLLEHVSKRDGNAAAKPPRGREIER